MWNVGARGRADSVGCDAPHPSCACRSRWRSAYATRWRLVGARWLDTVGQGSESRPATIARYAPDLIKDGYYRWLNRFYYVPLLVVGVMLFIFGGWGVLLWGVFLRTILAFHATWLVNSATHLWGKTRFETGDDSRNSWWVALLTFGEGWHNNHHAHPTSARHGLRWYEIDLNWLGIRALQFLGLAHSIKLLRFNRASSAWQLVSSRVRSNGT